MVNYLYDLKDIEENHEAYAIEGEVKFNDKLRPLIVKDWGCLARQNSPAINYYLKNLRANILSYDVFTLKLSLYTLDESFISLYLLLYAGEYLASGFQDMISHNYRP